MTPDPKNDDDFKQHLLNIEARLNRLSVSPQLSFDSLSARHDDEIDLREIWNILWSGKWWIIGITGLFAVSSVFYALSLPNKYRAEAVLATAQETSGGLSGIAAQYGGLAAMAGVNLGGGQSSDVDQAMALIRSWAFISDFVEKYDLKPKVMAVTGWDNVNDRIIYNEEIYDSVSNRWLGEYQPERPLEPTSYEVYRRFEKAIDVNRDTKSGLINLSVEHRVPRLAYEWLGLLIGELNAHFQNRDIREATRNIEYLRSKTQETGISEMQLVFYRMIESQMKTLMLAEVSDEYLIKTVVKSEVPEVKSGPRRAAICILGVIIGGIFSIVAVFIMHILRQLKTHKNAV